MAHPEPDPSCRLTVHRLLDRSRLEQVVVKLAVDARGNVVVVSFLEPDLTPAAKLELQRAFASCTWVRLRAAPPPEPWTTTWNR